MKDNAGFKEIYAAYSALTLKLLAEYCDPRATHDISISATAIGLKVPAGAMLLGNAPTDEIVETVINQAMEIAAAVLEEVLDVKIQVEDVSKAGSPADIVAAIIESMTSQEKH